MRAKPARPPAYWEQVQEEISAICRERHIEESILTWEHPLWAEVRSDAIERLYAKGRWQEVPF